MADFRFKYKTGTECYGFEKVICSLMSDGLKPV